MSLKPIAGMIALFLASVSFYLVPVICSSTAGLYIDPPMSFANVGEAFAVDIRIADIENLYSWQVNMSFDPTVLEFVNVTEGDFLKKQPEGTFAGLRDDHASEGWVLFGWATNGPYLGVTGSGTLATVEFLVLGVGESFLNIDCPKTKLLGIIPPPVPPGGEMFYEIPYTAENGYFNNLVAPPIPSFTWSPSIPNTEEAVTFDASASYDSDGVIVSYFWDFGDGTNGIGIIITHTYATTGTYTVMLTVTDDDGLSGTKSASIAIVGAHDIAISGVIASPTEVTVGELVSIMVNVVNEGFFSEAFAVTVYYDNAAIATTSVILDAGADTTLTFAWDTIGVAEGVYIIKAQASVVAGETDTVDNMFVDGTVVLVAPPAPLVLSVKLSGEHDYLFMEGVKIRLVALVEHDITFEPVSDADVTIEIYDPYGTVWVSDMMVERLAGTGIYEWESEETIRRLHLEKGVYLVHVMASSEGSLPASGILAFHIDPPGEEPAQLHLILLLVLIAALAISISVGYLDHRRLSRKLSELRKAVC